MYAFNDREFLLLSIFPKILNPCRGGALERGFRRVINNVPTGSLLVQSDSTTGEPLLLQVKLPLCVRQRHLAEEAYVFLLDAQVGNTHLVVF